MKSRDIIMLALAASLAACSSNPDDGGEQQGSDEACVLDVNEPITEPTTWDCATVNVLRNLSVESALTIKEGTEVVVTEGSHILVKGEGSLNAVGTPDARIVFRGVEPQKGYWGGIAFNSLLDDNVLDYVAVHDTGAPGFQNNSWAVAVIGGGAGNGKASLDGLWIRNASGYGVSIGSGAVVDASGWSFNDVDEPLIRTTFDSAHQIRAVHLAEGNAKEWIRVETGTLNQAVVWGTTTLPYRLVESPVMSAGGELLVAGGVTVEMGQDVHLNSKGGRFKFYGLPDEPVTITGVEKVPGYYGGISFHSMSEGNEIQHTVIEYAGGKNFQGESAAIVVAGDSTGAGMVSIRDTTIANSADIGVLVRKGGIAELNRVNYEGNGGQNLVDKNVE